MDKTAKLRESLKDFFKSEFSQMVFAVAKVVSVEGETCTVEIEGQKIFKVSDVRLKPTTGNTYNMLITPKTGSYALIASISGDLRDLQVLSADEIDKIEITQENMQIKLDAEAGTLSIENNDVSLFDLFTEITSLLRTKYKVYTPAGPSGLALPDTIAALNAFETNFKKLLK
jgi:hypothetical protein